MVEYKEYAELLGSPDSDKRGQAARIAAQAYLRHDGPENEHAALYAALLGFLDDESVRVRAALAFELLRTGEAPRPIMFALAYDARIIARAVVQYSPVLLDADLIGLIQGGDPGLRLAMAERENLGQSVISALIECKDTALDMAILRRLECAIAPADLTRLAARHARDPGPRDLLLCRPDLPGAARLDLVKQVGDQLSRLRIVKGAIGGRRLRRIMGDALDHATTGPFATSDPGAEKFIAELAGNGALTPRLMIHSLVNGRHMFFAAAISYLAGVPLGKAEAVLARGGRAALNAVLAKAGLSESQRNLVARLVILARDVDLGHDCAARHFVVATIIGDLITDHDGNIPADLGEVFSYLNEQNVALARSAARGAMASFMAGQMPGARMRVGTLRDQTPALPAA